MEANETEKLTDELQALADGAEALFESEPTEPGAAAGETRDWLAEVLQSAQKALETLNRKASAGMKTTDQFIRAKPYQALGVAVAVGVVIGLLLKRKRK